MKRILVIGCGNTLRSDDGLGPFIAEQLAAAAPPAGVHLDIASLPQLDLGLLDRMRDKDLVIFIDARQDEDNAQVKILRFPEQGLAAADGLEDAHNLGIATLLGLARDWHGARPTCYLILPKGTDFSIGDQLSPAARCAAAQCLREIAAILDKQGR